MPTITQVSVASKNASQGGGTFTSQAQTHTAGNLLVAVTFHQDAGDNISSVTNTAGDTWCRTRAARFSKNFGGSDRALEIWYTASSSAFGSTPVGTLGAVNDVVSLVSSAGNFYTGVTVYEFNKDTGTWGLVGDSNDSDGTSAVSSFATGTLTLTNPSVIVATIYSNSSGTAPAVAGAGYAVTSMTGDGFNYSESHITASSEAATATTTSGTTQYVMLAAAFQAAAGGGGGGTKAPPVFGRQYQPQFYSRKRVTN